MKFIIIMLAASFCVFIGIVKSSALKNRALELLEVSLMLEKIEVYLTYEKLPTKEIVQALAENESLSRLKFLRDCMTTTNENIPFPVIWRQALEENKNNMDLTADDRKIIHMLGTNLGSSDVKTQLNSIEMLKNLTKQALDEAQQGKEQKGKLYRSLGVLGGIGITLLLA